jgi:dihydroneopterin aldolase
MPADRITLTGLRVRGRHGVFPAERELGQEFVIDASVWLDTRPAAAGDALEKSVDYGELAQRLAAIVGGEPFLLIETLAEALATACLSHPLVARTEVTVHKPAAPIPLPFTDVSITVVRDRPAPDAEPGPR